MHQGEGGLHGLYQGFRFIVYGDNGCGIDTSVPGATTTMVIVSYPDGSKDTVPVTVTVSDSDAAAHYPGFSPASGEAGETVTVLQTGEKCLPGGVPI